MCTANMAGRTWIQELKSFKKRVHYYTILTFFIISAATSVNFEVNNKVVTVADANWTVILEGEWMLIFYAPWCPACQQIQTDWTTLAKQSTALGISVGKVDVTQQPGLSGRFLVTTLPTIFHAHDGSFRRYLSSRAVEDFQNYIIEKKWEAVEPVPGWKSPSSFVMAGMACLFRLSVWIRQAHSYLTETLGVPVWGSYVIFALATLFTGLLLGLILVLIADCLCPSRPRQKGRADICVNKDGSEEDMEDGATEEMQASDTEVESAKVSGEESAGEDIIDAADSEQPEGAPEGMVRRRKPHPSETADLTPDNSQ